MCVVRSARLTNNWWQGARTVERSFAKMALRGMTSVDAAFRQLDADESGTVTTGEFVQSLRRQGLKLGDEVYGQLIHKYDPDNTGKISLANFRSRFHSVLRPKTASTLCTRHMELFASMLTGMRHPSSRSTYCGCQGGYQNCHCRGGAPSPRGSPCQQVFQGAARLPAVRREQGRHGVQGRVPSRPC